MTRKPRPWAVTSEYRVRRNAPDAFGGTRQFRAVEICWRRPPHDPSGPAEVWVVARDQPDWADTTRWAL